MNNSNTSIELDKMVEEIQNKIKEDYFVFPEGVDIIYHYTDANTLIKILETNMLWATNVQFMNDTQEIEYSIEKLTNCIKQTRHNQSKDLNNKILKFYNSHLLKNLRNNIERMFISSFSFDADSLHLWNSYGKNDGYAIGISFAEYMKSFKEKNIKLIVNGKNDYKYFSFYCGKVLYDEELQEGFLKFLIESLNKFLVKWYNANTQEERYEIEKRRSHITQIMISGLYSMKSYPHRIEDEYRMTIVPNRSFDNVNFLSKNGIITPHIEYRGNLNINSITIGPKIKDEIAFQGIISYLKALGISDMKIKKSKIGIR